MSLVVRVVGKAVILQEGTVRIREEATASLPTMTIMPLLNSRDMIEWHHGH